MAQEMHSEYKRIVFIDILKSIACICVLVGHVINGMIKDGMDVAFLLRALNSYVYLFHVPCFFFASGYLYANKKLDKWGDYPRFILKKLLVLGLPYFVCSIAYILFSSVMSSEMHTSYAFDAIVTLWKEPVAQYWYLYALFEMFLVVPIVELVLHRVDRGWILLLFIACALCIHVDITCVNYFMSYTCFFYMGTWLNQSGIMRTERTGKVDSGRLLGISCVVSLVIYVGYELTVTGVFLPAEINDILKGIVKLLLVITVVGISVAFAGMNNLLSTFLVWLSQYSLYIYLFHTWFTGTLRILMSKAGILNSWIQTICEIAVGVTGSLIAAIIIKKVPLFRFWFEPLQTAGKK